MRNLYFTLFLVLLVLHSLGAYAVFSVPFPWFGQAGLVVLCLYMAYRTHLILPPGFLNFMAFVVYAILITFFFSTLQDYSALMPAKATTPYGLFIFLRFFQLASFGATLLVVYWLCREGYEKQMTSAIATLGVVIAIYSIYVYIAQLYGLPEPPRTRVGTSGGEQSTKFSYAFHRAMGSFREPSHLAEWLILPIFLSFFYRSKWSGLRTLLLSMVLLITGSLTGIISLVVGFVVALALGFKSHGEAIKGMIRIALSVTVALLVFSSVVVVKSGTSGGAYGALWKRIEPLLDEKGQGVKKTNRNYVYNYIEKRGLGIIGPGLGNSNLEFSRTVGLDATASFLNLFINVGASLGFVGLILLGFFLLRPFLEFFGVFYRGLCYQELFYVGAFAAWLLIYVMHSEELSVHFAVIYALLVYRWNLNPQQRDSL